MVLRQLFDEFRQPIGIQPLDDIHDLTVKRPMLLYEQTSIGHLVRERVKALAEVPGHAPMHDHHPYARPPSRPPLASISATSA